MANHKEVLIERWLPIEAIGAECMRDGSAAKKPPLNRLHVWWARRPLTASRAAILASVLPNWSADWPTHLLEKFPREEEYQKWFLRACGIFGDPVAGKKLIAWAKDRGVQLKTPPYSHKRAFTVSPSSEVLETIARLLEHAWGTPQISVLDPFAGGGSIPFEALRYGFKTYANELNPVAGVILKATLEYPARFGASLVNNIRKYGGILSARVRDRLERFYPQPGGESIYAYLWARTVRCPYTGKWIPLAPNWWLRQGSSPVAIKPIFDETRNEAQFQIITGKAACAQAQPDKGLVKRGNAVSPWAHHQAVSGDHIKTEAQAGQLREQLYAAAFKQKNGFGFRIPTEDELKAVTSAEEEWSRRAPEWEARGWIPTEPRQEGRADWAARIYGLHTWADTFTHRQLLSLITYLAVLDELRPTIRAELSTDRAEAILTYLAIALDKAADYNSRQVSWDVTRQKIRNTFTRHDFSSFPDGHGFWGEGDRSGRRRAQVKK
jgi:adenine-specific DNA methylase